MSDWYYAKDNEQKGPVNKAELKELLATKAIPEDALVWCENMEAWTEASQVQELTFRPPPAPAISKSEAVTAPALAEEKLPLLEFNLDPVDTEKNRTVAMLTYLPFLFILALIPKKKSPFALFHANQGLVLYLFWLLMLGPEPYLNNFIIGILPHFLNGLVWVIALINVLPIILVALGIRNAYQGKLIKLPIIGGLIYFYWMVRPCQRS